MIQVPGLEACRARFRLVSLDLPESALARLKAFVTEEELQRGNRLLDRKKGERFLAGRGVLREALAEVTGEEPGRIRLSEGEFGKPFLVEQPGPETIRFSLSHAGSYLLLALSTGGELGVDLEQVLQELTFRPMAERYFSRREQEELFSLAPEQQLKAFYRCWTRKEAYLKGTGTGFSQPCTSFDVSLLPHQAPALLAHRISPGEVGRWSIHELSVPQGYCAALAVEKPENKS